MELFNPVYIGVSLNIIGSCTQEIDRFFLKQSSRLTEPFCFAWSYLRYRMIAPLDPRLFDNREKKIHEVAFRGLIGLGAVFGAGLIVVAPVPSACAVAALGIASKVCRAIGFGLQKDGYTHVKGDGLEKELEGQIKVMTWNICGVGGGMHFDHGGVLDWRSRLSRIIDKIQKEDPDVLVLQEIYDTALAEALVQKLKGEYAHFFLHLGPNVWGGVGGCLVISKCAVHRFIHTSFSTNKWTLNRGFASLELKRRPQDSTPCIRVVGTHLIHGNAAIRKATRCKQFAEIMADLEKKDSKLPTILAGDLNIDRDSEEGIMLSTYLQHGYRKDDDTCTNALVKQWSQKAISVEGRKLDYISLFKERIRGGQNLTEGNEKAEILNCRLIKAFDSAYNTKKALSDHHGLIATVKITDE